MSIFKDIKLLDALESGCITLQMKNCYSKEVDLVWNGIAKHIFTDFYFLEVEIADSKDPAEEVQYWKVLNKIFEEVIEINTRKDLVANIIYAVSSGYVPVGVPKSFLDNIVKSYKNHTKGIDLFKRRAKDK
jgi:hypothetical protein